MKKRLVVGNWKMNPTDPKEAKMLFNEIKRFGLRATKTNIVICPPAIFLSTLSASGNIKLGTQDIFQEESGAYTGKISGLMARESGANFTILGHSEMRATGDTAQIINKKIIAALKSHLRPIVCVGEKIRDDKGAFWKELKNDIEICFGGIQKSWLAEIIVAYEPVWAIGKNALRDATSEEINEVVIFIRKVLADIFGKSFVEKVPIIYGGSVTPKNAINIFGECNIDGVLVGRSSLKPKEFKDIVTAAENI